MSLFRFQAEYNIKELALALHEYTIAIAPIQKHINVDPMSYLHLPKKILFPANIILIAKTLQNIPNLRDLIIATDLKLIVTIEYELFTVNSFILKESSVVIGINVLQLVMQPYY